MNTKKKSFKLKIIVPTFIVLIVLVVIINVFLSIRLSNIGNSLINEKLISVKNGLDHYMDESEGKTHVAALTAALYPEVVEAVGNRDTEALISLLSPVCDLYLIDYFTITDSEGTVLARTYEPESFGDSVINQQNVRDSLDGKTSTYLEPGTLIQVSIRSGAPVYGVDGTIIGAISAGIRLDSENKVEDLKELFGSEVTIFRGDTRITSTIVRNGQSIAGTTLDPAIASIVFGEKTEYVGDVDVLGAKYKTYYKPLLDSHDDAFAAIVIGIPLANLTAEAHTSIRDGIILGLGGLAVSIALLYIMISSLSQPITKLSGDMHYIASGNLGIDVTVKGDDEVGNLGESLQKVADTLNKLLNDINKTIEEHEKGNIDYLLDTEAFFGDYKRLADNIVELSATGMRDQLTGISNRRAFDNRLSLEWNRASRNRSPLGILILDVDKFKNYNDTFGHQQGDVALKTVARTIKEALRRPTDFPARWGGEEFVVLLPDTGSNGAAAVAEVIRSAIEAATIPCPDIKGTKITASIGINVQIPTPDSKLEEFVPGADAALYRAKEEGRNRAVLGGTGFIEY